MAELCDFHIEPRVVDEDDHVGFPGEDVLLAEGKVGKEFSGLGEDIRQAHYGTFPVVADKGRAAFLHQVSAPAAQLRLRVFGLQAFDEVAAVQVARGFARYQIISHSLSSSLKSVLSMLPGVMLM